MQGGERYNSIGNYLKKEFGRKMVKLSIDAGFICPNRDGSLAYGGCAFCSEGGSGELASHMQGASSNIHGSISEQIDKLSEKWPDAGYIAYFQSFTNTYAPVEKLRALYYEALSDPRIEGIAIATRPDCLGEDVLDLLEEINKLGIGAAGYGGSQTALAVHVLTHPVHLASLPVAVNIQCHAARHKSIVF